MLLTGWTTGCIPAPFAQWRQLGSTCSLLPGLLAGIPALLILTIVLLQIAGGVARLPFVKRWLGGTGVQTPPQRRGP